jgi:rhamnose utilization protein RhaD (predicted bifunctional aldolase and dehydrogenase)
MAINHQTISQMCADLGKDPLLVQGAGGNVSWKENETLWIKGSGTWLANANDEDIFVPVNFKHLQDALSNQDFEAKPELIGEHILRPSIETVLHALMPHQVVVHVHAINALSHLVTQDCNKSIQQICQKSSINAAFVGYHKPGPELAQAIYKALQSTPEANVIFLQNHGVVIGADSIKDIYSLLNRIDTALTPKQASTRVSASLITPTSPIEGYIPFADSEVQALACDPHLFKRLRQDWVLFPDHAVFLGPKANTYSSWENFQNQASREAPELIFIENAGVFVKPEFNQAKTAQLRCYFDVISRVSPDACLEPLSESAIYALLNWDAEKLRQQMSQKQ